MPTEAGSEGLPATRRSTTRRHPGRPTDAGSLYAGWRRLHHAPGASGAACFWRIAPRNGGLRRRHTAEVFDGKDHCAGKSKRNRDDEEKEAGRERGLLLDPELRQEADEEGLAHGEPVDREGNEDHEKEQRTHYVIGPRREVEADRSARHPDREHTHALHSEREQ